MADGQGKERPIVLKEIEPKVGAVAIICDGGDNNEVKLKLTLTVSTLFDIPSHKITITKRMIGR